MVGAEREHFLNGHFRVLNAVKELLAYAEFSINTIFEPVGTASSAPRFGEKN